MRQKPRPKKSPISDVRWSLTAMRLHRDKIEKLIDEMRGEAGHKVLDHGRVVTAKGEEVPDMTVFVQHWSVQCFWCLYIKKEVKV